MDDLEASMSWPKSAGTSATMGAQPNQDDISTIQAYTAAIAVSFPPFWVESPLAWFSAVESSFNASNITSESTKYYKLISALPEKVAMSIIHITSKGYFAGCYEEVKTSILNEFTPPKAKRLRQLCSMVNVRTKRPREILREMRTLMVAQNEEETIKMSEADLKLMLLDALPKEINLY